MSSEMAKWHILAGLLAGIVEEMLASSGSGGLEPQRIIEVGCDLIDASDRAALTTVRDGQLQMLACTGGDAEAFIALQLKEGHGPAWRTFQEAGLVVIDDLGGDTRWPELGPVAAEHGIRSLVCVSLHLTTTHRAVLSLYSAWPHAFDEVAVAAASIIGSYCSLAALVSVLADEAVGSDHARQTHRELGLAIGIVMRQRDTDASRALSLLHQAAEGMHANLPEVASDVVQSRRLNPGRK